MKCDVDIRKDLYANTVMSGGTTMSLVLLTGCRRRSLLLLHPPSRSRSLLPQRGNTPSGSEDPSLHPSPPSSRCGSPSRSMMSVAHPLFTANAFKSILIFLYQLPYLNIPFQICTIRQHVYCLHIDLTIIRKINTN